MKKSIAFTFSLLVLLLVGCSSKYNPENFIGKTSEEIISQYGSFDCLSMPADEDGLYKNCRCGYTIKKAAKGFLGESEEELFFILDFAKSVKKFYDACTPKEIPNDEFDRNGYAAFWNEWQRRYNDGLMLLSLETGREMEMSHDGLHYFVSHKDGEWSLYCEESKEMQLFQGWYALYENARFGDKLLRDEIAGICFDAIL